MTQEASVDRTDELLRMYAVQEGLTDQLAYAWHSAYDQQLWHTYAADRARLLSEQKRRWPIKVKWHGIPIWRKVFKIGIDKYWRPFARWGISTSYGMVRLQRYGPITLIIGEDEALGRAIDERGAMIQSMVLETRACGNQYAQEELARQIQRAERPQ